MDRMLYVAMAAARQTMTAQAISSNNLANVSTSGFRRDFEASVGLSLEADKALPSRAYSQLQGRGMDQEQGAIFRTGNNLDVAIRGEGFIAVRAPDGREAYTRNGELRVDPLGRLVTPQGAQVLGEDGPILIPPYTQLEINEAGAIAVLPAGGFAQDIAIVDTIRLVNPPPQLLDKGRDGLIYRSDDQASAVDPTIQVVAGSLERSNVNMVHEMVRQIELARRFEAQIKVMSTASDLEESTNQLLRSG